MKKSILAAAALAAIAFSLEASALDTGVAPEVKGLKTAAPQTVLYVGNSFTYYNCGVNGYVRGLANASHEKWKARQITISSGRISFHPIEEYLEDHALDPYAKGKVKDGKLVAPMFDIVFLQGQSSEPIDPKASPTYRKYLKKAIEEVRKAGSEPVVVVTWAQKDKPADTRKLADATIAAANENHAVALPVGLAFEESLKARPDLILHAPDKRHPSAAGSYLYGAMMYSLLFRKSPEGLNFLGGCEKPLKASDAKFLQGVAWRVTKEFYGW